MILFSWNALLHKLRFFIVCTNTVGFLSYLSSERILFRGRDWTYVRIGGAVVSYITNLEEIVFIVCGQKQGCQIFIGTTYQTEEKYSK
jgi:hypothetical protein